jgi:CubicO group peptidase (beta-lactamase class C family)
LRDEVKTRFKGKAFGLAGGLIVEPPLLDHSASAGELFWRGIAGTQWWISRRANVAGVMMAQRQMAFFHPFASEFKRLAYEAVRRKTCSSAICHE